MRKYVEASRRKFSMYEYVLVEATPVELVVTIEDNLSALADWFGIPTDRFIDVLYQATRYNRDILGQYRLYSVLKLEEDE